MAVTNLLNSKPKIKTKTLFTLCSRLFSSAIHSSCKRPHQNTNTLFQHSPPVAKKVPFTVTGLGKTWQDPYHWMKNTKDPDFLDYLDKENSYAQAFMADTHGLRSDLVSEMRSRLPTQISPTRERWGPWLYYQYVPEGREYPVLCRKLATEESGWPKKILGYLIKQIRREQILLDWNEIAEQYGYVHIGSCRISPDHNFLAYTLDITGSEHFMLQIKDLRDGSALPSEQADGVVSLAWAKDNKTLFYTISDENQRPNRVMFRKLGSNEVEDTLIYTESNSSFCVDITSTKDGNFITVNSNSRTSSEVHVIDAANPLNGMKKVWKRMAGVQYFLEHCDGVFYILTNAPLNGEKVLPGRNYYLARRKAEDLLSSNWKDVILPSADMTFHDMDICDGNLVLFVNKMGLHGLCSINLPIKFNDDKDELVIEDLDPWFFPMPSDFCNIVPGSNNDFMSPVYRVVLSSPVMPDVSVDYDMSKRKFSIVYQENVRAVSSDCESDSSPEHNGKCCQNDKFDTWKGFSDLYSCERIEVVSHDGVMVPLTIFYSPRAWKSGVSPGLLHGYGAYGEVLDKSWCADRLSLLERGWLLAFADVRGGGGGDFSWHESGSKMNKHNSLQDFLSCAKYLVEDGFVHRDMLAAIGESAGGLLVGAVINTNPNIFRAAILKVPFLDICNTLLDPSLPLSLLDYEEFGNPQIPSQFDCLTSYSPYNNIHRNGCYPSMLVTASLHDSRVGVWEPAKYVAKIRDITCSSCSLSVILKTNMYGGHFGQGGCYSYCEGTAYEYAFLIKVMENAK